MARPCLTAALVVCAFALVGCSDDSTPVSPTSGSTATEERARGAAHVRRVFARHGLPLRQQPVSPREIRGLRLYRSGSAGPVFQVEVYPTVDRAIESQQLTLDLIPGGYRVRGSISRERQFNVVVVFETGRPLVKRRFRAALAELR
jgi:hypothetical protein